MVVPYLDNAATTAADPRVVDTMRAMLGSEGTFGNAASSTHAYGAAARREVAAAREQVANLLHADPREVVFTSGATEADNLALKGVAEQYPRGHIVTSAIEHRAVLDTCAYLARRGHEVTCVAPTADGSVAVDAVADAIRPDTCVVSIMHANNEVGVINDIDALAHLCLDRRLIFHSDATQTFGKLTLDTRQTPVDLISVSAHKMHGPKGVGALYVRRRPGLAISPQIHGGNQERGLRSGTLPNHQLAGFGEACRIAGEGMESDNKRVGRLRDRLEAALSSVRDLRVNGTGRRLPGHLNVAVGGVNGEILLGALAQQVAVSSGSACTSASMTPSHVLKAMGLSDELAHASVRFSLGRFTTEQDIDTAITSFKTIVERLQRRQCGVRQAVSGRDR